SLGPAPKWCGFLDNLTEELEENIIENVYDDYKFVTRQELEDLGLGHLIGCIPTVFRVVKFVAGGPHMAEVVFLQCDRFVEFHSAGGRYYRLRIPKFGRDMQYHAPSTDLFLVGATSEIYRLNLERGQFLSPFMSEGSELNSIAINPVHQLICVGTIEGKVEAWDPRMKVKAGTLDCAFNCISNERDTVLEGFPSISSLNFNGPLTLGVGTHTGQILLYDIQLIPRARQCLHP
ncbi:nucleolar protein 10-like, partial [Diaphorina citri]|uniref:Nucleolar protein 10-like n=1 Tax=Diaphorina citri TaxID=121845 RepID=A0A1S4EDG5_DIACI